MENPEEILHALDQFQKVRPSEIPRELEEYLCWVAKTGDPVYQWGLIKVLFREKLMRVMSEFHESCPSLDLTPCPNVEVFNYDSMKNSLLERLESFASAPFTVQRICELLTTPRKEYNRVDKFMRAIEKNILVVSTKEPGACGHNSPRSENGDGLVNGSIESESGMNQATDIDMEPWTKDCTTTANISMHIGENNGISIENNLESTIKNTFIKQSSVASSIDESRIDPSFVVSSTEPHYVTSESDFTTITSTVSQESESLPHTPVSVVQNLTTVNHENNELHNVADNLSEDSNSQPSLELESGSSDNSVDSSEVSDKLQNIFQPKDFILNETSQAQNFDLCQPQLESNESFEKILENKYYNILKSNDDSSQKLCSLNNQEESHDSNDQQPIEPTSSIITSNTSEVALDENLEKETVDSQVHPDNVENVGNSLEFKGEHLEEGTTASVSEVVSTKENDQDCEQNNSENSKSESLISALDSQPEKNNETGNQIHTDSPITETKIPTEAATSEKSWDVLIEETSEDDMLLEKIPTVHKDPIIEEPVEIIVPQHKKNDPEVLVEIEDEGSSAKDEKNGYEEISTECPNAPEEGDNEISPMLEDGQTLMKNREEICVTNKEVSESMDIDTENAQLDLQPEEPMEQESTEVLTS